MDRLFAPRWAGGWTAMRLAFGVTLLFSTIGIARGIGDAFGAPDMVFDVGPWHVATILQLTPGSAWAVWACALVGILGVLAGGRAMRPGLVLWFLGTWTLLLTEGLNVRAHDRLAAWMAIGLFLSPAGERDLANKARGPVGRWWILVVFAALYGSTGWLKILHEPEGWASGEVLAYHLLHREFAGSPLANWAAAQPWITMPASWLTIVFEASFPFLVWWRATNPWILLGGVALHIGIAALMDVGKFSWVALAAYPVLLHPDVAHALWQRIRR
jgi:hypothetical protein